MRARGQNQDQANKSLFALKADHQISMGDGIPPAYKPNLDFLEDDIFDEDVQKERLRRKSNTFQHGSRQKAQGIGQHATPDKNSVIIEDEDDSKNTSNKNKESQEGNENSGKSFQ